MVHGDSLRGTAMNEIPKISQDRDGELRGNGSADEPRRGVHTEVREFLYTSLAGKGKGNQFLPLFILPAGVELGVRQPMRSEAPANSTQQWRLGRRMEPVTWR